MASARSGIKINKRSGGLSILKAKKYYTNHKIAKAYGRKDGGL